MNSRSVFGLVVLGAIVAAQMTATFCSVELYPLSPYRMFSRNWPAGIVMENVRLKMNGREFTPWQALDIPFFQANSMMYQIFLDSASIELKTKTCALLHKGLMSSEAIAVKRVETQYGDPGRPILRTAENANSIVYTCPKL